ncbi:MAG: TetM/TetW/TetO/TetS family tetracycline resistance ribosomal protection protein [Clostridia bacterium]|nr:TetM/TetW/TetO/TetS family tetracycline resistance ribosomal protection protein [Clostridia bacterium]
MKRLTMGILAHVDAGKTTLSEALLYRCGSIRKIGRVDHKNAFLDTSLMERERGITIFSKQAILNINSEAEITLLDTPGHVDFSGEAERTLPVLDYAIMVISAPEGIQAHTSTIWHLLSSYKIPTFVFINKTDLPSPIREVTLRALQDRFGSGFIDFTSEDQQKLEEEISMCDEELLDRLIAGTLTENMLTESTAKLVARRKIFPCFFGSALKLSGVDGLIEALLKYTVQKKHPEGFGARVYKITRDESGNRLTHMKITGGVLKTKDAIKTSDETEEKVEQIRIYSGSKFTSADRAVAGQICAVLGLDRSFGGQGLGNESHSYEAMLQPVLTYRIIPPKDCNIAELYSFVCKLGEEEPGLSLSWNERLGEIHIKVMGEVQLDVIHRQIFDRFGADVRFDEGNIVYKETIAEPVFGVGHFEPLRHYAEVHLMLEPTGEGSGLSFDTLCSENSLNRNWQRLILTHLGEKQHLGTLTGSPITDMRITLVAGRAHKKHTEGGDFRQATYRAVRQGLMNARAVLLEPYYNFRLTLPKENIGRALSDIGLMHGDFSTPEMVGEDEMLLCGSAPVREMRSYAKEVSAYTKGLGKLSLAYGGYKKCHSPEKIAEEIGYDPERDPDNSPDSVFCTGGAGFLVKWNEVEEHMHLEASYMKKDGAQNDTDPSGSPISTGRRYALSYEENVLMDKELLEIFEKTYGPIRKRALPPEKRISDYNKKPPKPAKQKASLPEYLLVDGYNIIFAWDDLRKIAEDNLNLARKLLIDILCNYQGYKDCGLILVFDAYKVTGGKRTIEKQGGIHVVYTKEAETADAYIEKVSLEMAKKYRVRVATSDNLEQMIVLGHGAERIPARLFFEEVCQVRRLIDEQIEQFNNQ